MEQEFNLSHGICDWPRTAVRLAIQRGASLHHGNFEAMLAHIEGDEKKLSILELPSTEWVVQALISGHVYLLQALDTLNDCLQLGFDKRLEAANAEFQDVWGKRLRAAK